MVLNNMASEWMLMFKWQIVAVIACVPYIQNDTIIHYQEIVHALYLVKKNALTADLC